MPADYIIDPAHKVVFSRGYGIFTHADYLDHMTRLKRDRSFNPDFCQVVDCRDITLMNISAGQIEDLAKSSVFNSGSKRAFVVSGPIQFGLSRMHASYREARDGQQVMVFKELCEALAWLGLPPDSAPQRDGSSGGGSKSS